MNTSEIVNAMIFGDGGASKIEELSTDGGSTDAGKVLVVGDNGKIAASDLTVGEGKIALDKTLSVNGAAADAKKTGDAIAALNGSLDTKLDAPPSAGTVTDVYETFFKNNISTYFTVTQNPDLSCDVGIKSGASSSGQSWAVQNAGTYRIKFRYTLGFICIGYYSSNGESFDGRIGFNRNCLYLLSTTGKTNTELAKLDGGNNVFEVGDTVDVSWIGSTLTIDNGEEHSFNIQSMIDGSDAFSGTYASNFVKTNIYLAGIYKNSVYAGNVQFIVLNDSKKYDINGDVDTENTITVTTSEEGSIVVSDGAGGTKWGSVLGKSHWYGKTWYAYGSSLTNIASEGKYASELASISGLTLVNKGISGGGIITNRRIYNALLDNTDGKVNADLITIEVGANDSASPLGTPLDLTNDTFCGSLNVCIKNILTNCPKAQVIIMPSTRARYVLNDPTTLYDLDTVTTGGFTFVERDEAIRKVALANGIYFIPLSALVLGIYRMQSSNAYNVDNIHHTQLGGYNLAQGIWGYLKNIPLWYTAIPE